MINRKAAWRGKTWGSLPLLKNGTLDGTFKGQVRLNRSQKWTPAQSYQQAREMSPSSRPVR